MLAHRTNPSNRRLIAGVSLVEVMIAMTLGLLVLAGMTAVFVNNSQSRREMNNAATQLENGRYALQILKDEISLAGYYDALSTLTTGATSASACSTTVGDWDESMVIAVEGRNGDETAFSCIGTAKADTGMIFLQRSATTEVNTAALDADDVGKTFLQIQMCGAQYDAGNRMVLSTYSTGTGTAPYSMQTKKCDGTASPLREYIRQVFFIGTSNGVPVLQRRNIGSGVTETLVEGIEDLHFEYAIDTDNNGSPDEFKETPEVDAAAGINDLEDIVGVRIWLIARSLLPTAGYADSKNYLLGTKESDKIEGLLDTSFKRHVFSTYVELTHPVARREK